MSISKVQKVWNNADLAKMRNVSWLNISYFGFDAVSQFMGNDYYNDLAQSIHKLLLNRSNINEKDLTGLAIACGDMTGEITLFKSVVATFNEIDGIDISNNSLEKAKSNVLPYKISFKPILMDCNKIQLEENRYDLIVGHHAIHHIENLENLFLK